jgi:DNA-binding transcriptional ArsR family regulator
MAEKSKSGEEETVERINQIAYILKGIGHSVRLQIIQLLESGVALSVGDIQSKLEIEQTVLSHHLSKMRDMGLLIAERDGKKIYYRLKDEQISQIISCMKKCDIF